MIADSELSRILYELGEEEKPYGAISPPIISTSNFRLDTIANARNAFANEKDHHLYSRGNNPTVRLLEKKVAALQGAEDALFFGSGAAAIAAAIVSQLKAGDHVICVENAYSWTHKLFTQTLSRFNVETTFVDGREVDNFKKELRENTRLIFLESPTSLTFQLQDIRSIVAWAKAIGLKVICDHSYASPLNRKPVEFGVDLICHTATKFIGGHSDVVAGVVCGNATDIRRIFEQEYMTFGAVLSPENAWLLIRSLRTIKLRIDHSSITAKAVVAFLKQHPKVEKILWPHDVLHPQYPLALGQFEFETPLFSFLLKTNDEGKLIRFAESFSTVQMAVSWGGYESLIIPSVIWPDSPYPINMIRMYVGFESAGVLIADLERALSSID